MLFSDITIISEDFKALEHMYVGVEGDKIAYVGAEAPKADFGQTYDGRGKLLMSGFYNAHSHSPMTLLRGYGENMVLSDWLNKKIFPFEAKLDEKAVYAGTMLAMAESIRYGIVSSSDMYYYLDAMGPAVAESGAKMNMSHSVLCFTEQALEELPFYDEVLRGFKTWNGAESGRINVDFALHGEYTSTEKVARGLADLAKSLHARVQVHVSETKSETDECKERRGGKTPIEYLESVGMLDNPVTAGHCVWVTENDIDIMAEKHVTVATCPISNLKIASGVANVPLMLKKGVNVSISTDGVASNNNLNYMEDLQIFSLVHKGRWMDPTAITPAETIYAATRAGALSQGRDDCGLLKEGYKADLIVFDVNRPNMTPVHDMLNNLVYAATGGDIVLTMVDGAVLYENGEYKTIDVEKTMADVRLATENILKQL